MLTTKNLVVGLSLLSLNIWNTVAEPVFVVPGVPISNTPQHLQAIPQPETYYPPSIPASSFSEPIPSIAALNPQTISHGPIIVYLKSPQVSSSTETLFVPYILKSDGVNPFSLTVSNFPRWQDVTLYTILTIAIFLRFYSFLHITFPRQQLASSAPSAPPSTTTQPTTIPTASTNNANVPLPNIPVSSVAPTPMPAPKTSTKGGSGWTILFLVSAFALCYIAIGYWYNNKTEGLTGFAALPHIEFWMSIPAYAITGCVFTIDTITSLIRNGPSSFSSRSHDSFIGGASYHGNVATHPRLKGASSRMVGIGPDDYDEMHSIVDGLDHDIA